MYLIFGTMKYEVHKKTKNQLSKHDGCLKEKHCVVI